MVYGLVLMLGYLYWTCGTNSRGKVFNSRSHELSQTITNLQVHIEKYFDKLRECVSSLARC